MISSRTGLRQVIERSESRMCDVDLRSIKLSICLLSHHICLERRLKGGEEVLKGRDREESAVVLD